LNQGGAIENPEDLDRGSRGRVKRGVGSCRLGFIFRWEGGVHWTVALAKRCKHTGDPSTTEHSTQARHTHLRRQALGDASWMVSGRGVQCRSVGVKRAWWPKHKPTRRVAAASSHTSPLSEILIHGAWRGITGPHHSPTE